ncbi:MAG: hypothetical protein KDI71_22115 [Xanthomonadales bacterium]|nr:hypothetical protein [Anaerolineae bacterium]MCB1609668.1 hypothetical protein [Xanthomonadales bacterium]
MIWRRFVSGALSLSLPFAQLDAQRLFGTAEVIGADCIDCTNEGIAISFDATGDGGVRGRIRYWSPEWGEAWKATSPDDQDGPPLRKLAAVYRQLGGLERRRGQRGPTLATIDYNDELMADALALEASGMSLSRAVAQVVSAADPSRVSAEAELALRRRIQRARKKPTNG